MVQKSTDRPVLPATADPAEFPLGSPESRAVARLLAQEMRPPQAFVEVDDNGTAIYELGKRYADRIVMVPRLLDAEEWAEKQHAWAGLTPEEQQAERKVALAKFLERSDQRRTR